MTEENDWTQPLLARPTSPVRYVEGIDNTIWQPSRREDEERINDETSASRYVENDVIPETSNLERRIGWSSAYILIISRVIGSGIFATPGLIFRSVGSIGLSLLLWIIGAFVAWLGLAVALEYGCMLPRSGGVFSVPFNLTFLG
jgi:amino acid permease